jgi:hypothetical protein
MTAFSSGNGVVSLPPNLSSYFTPQVWDPKVMKLLIMLHSLSLCLTGYAWFGQASTRSLLKWSIGSLAERLSLHTMVEMCLMPELVVVVVP